MDIAKGIVESANETYSLVVPSSSASVPATTTTSSPTTSLAATLQLWATISRGLWWTVLLISLASIGVLAHSLYAMLTRYRRSAYFHFLVAMLLLNQLMLASIVTNLVSSDSALAAWLVRGSVMCRLTAFLTNATSCFTNWLWVMMFAQRLAHLFPFFQRAPMKLRSISSGTNPAAAAPMSPSSSPCVFSSATTLRNFLRYQRRRLVASAKHSLYNTLDDTRRLITFTGVVSAASQLWAPFLMREVVVRRDAIGDGDAAMEGSYCGPDSTVVDEHLFKWIAALESIWTYALPFTITLLTDAAVLVYTRESTTSPMTGTGSSNANGRKLGRKSRRRRTSGVVVFATVSTEQLRCGTTSTTRRDNHNHHQHHINSLVTDTNSGGEAIVGGGGGTGSEEPTTATPTSSSTLTQTQERLLSLVPSPSPPLPPWRRWYQRRGNLRADPPSTLNLIRPTFSNNNKANNATSLPANNYHSSPSSSNFANDQCQNHHNPTHHHLPSSMKIQSSASIRIATKRRQRAIRRCLLLATTQLLLNLPNYVLQLVDEFSQWRATSQRFMVFYLYADALFYLLYLAQYPMLAVYVQWLHASFNEQHRATTALNVNTAAVEGGGKAGNSAKRYSRRRSTTTMISGHSSRCISNTTRFTPTSQASCCSHYKNGAPPPNLPIKLAGRTVEKEETIEEVLVESLDTPLGSSTSTSTTPEETTTTTKSGDVGGVVVDF